MIESDNVDEKLYSSESETTSSSGSTETSTSEEKNPKGGVKPIASTPFQQQQQKKLNFSSSSSNSLQEPKRETTVAKPAVTTKPEAAKPVQAKPANPVQALNFQSDSDSPEMKQKPMGATNPYFQSPNVQEEIDISGPENELDDDDFWN